MTLPFAQQAPRPIRHPFLWYLAESQVWFLGTIHQGPPGGFRFPEHALTMIDSVESYCFELDPLVKPNLGFLQRSAGSLVDDLGPETFAALQAQLPGAELRHLTVWGAAIVAGARVWTALDFVEESGVDRFVFARARAAKKNIAFLETEADQVRAITSGSLAEAVAAIRRVIADPGLQRRTVERLVSGYVDGDLSAIAESRVLAQQIRPEFSAAMFAGREDRWMPIIDNAIAQNRRTLFAVGIVHFAGQDGLIARLSAKYKVLRFPRLNLVATHSASRPRWRLTGG